ncbi:MAG: type II toxin-antitoxin system VapC family toxin [Chloroflexi bacterium]|nr:type II toxin-antitoxin system VapC family toxin [Chloroflexota bacterium]
MVQRLLLDTHTLLWAIEGGRKLRLSTLGAIFVNNHVYVSAASYWEIAIKAALGKLQLANDPLEFIENSGFTELPVYFRHAVLAASLPLHHRDPFDRMLIAQAQAERLTLVTDDSHIARYDVRIMPAR